MDDNNQEIISETNSPGGTDVRPSRARLWFLPLALLIIGIATSYGAAMLHYRVEHDETREDVRREVELIGSDLSRELFGALKLMEGISGFISIEGDISDDRFRAFSTELLQRNSLIRNIAVAPDNVVKFNFPLKGNEAIIGFDYTKSTDQWPSVEKMIRENHVVVGGPVALVQGGIGVIGRTPIYVSVAPDPRSGSRRYWGLTSTVIEFEKLLAKTPISASSERLTIAMRGRDGLGEQGELFFGDANTFDTSPVLIDVVLPAGTWQLAAIPRGGWPPFQILRSTYFQFGSVLSIALALLLLKLFLVGDARQHAVLARVRVEQDNQLFRALLDRSNDFIQVVDPETGRFLDVNERACIEYGYARNEFLDLHVWDVDPAGNRNGFIKRIAELRESGALKLEIEHQRKDGTTFPIEIGVSYVKLEREYAVAVVRDITDRKRLEAQFLHSQKMESVGRLAGGVAHDFNNMLTVIIGTADLALTRLHESNRLHSDLTEIRRAGSRAALLTRQLLTFSRKQIVEPKLLDLGVIVLGMQSMLQRLIGENISISIMSKGDNFTVLADPGQIEQVVMNLAVNARDAMPDHGMMTIEIAIVELDEIYCAQNPAVQPGQYVMLAVTDTGAGMDETTRELLFEPFFTTKGQGKGTGLGLAVVYGIVKQSGGSIWVYSEVGNGTTFKIYLPLVDEVSNEVERQIVGPNVRCTETVLVVEDEDGVRGMADRILKEAGYLVLTASNGADALKLIERHDGIIHLLLTDVVMPDMAGPALAKQVLDSSSETKVLYTSGYTGEAIVRHGVLEKDRNFIDKPYTVKQLTHKVREVLDA